MAQASAVLTYDMVTNREDLSDVIYNISKDETPFLSGLGKTKASARYHEWVQDSLTSPADNAFIEGDEYSYVKRSTPSRVGNYTQIFVTDVEVSDTQRAVDPAGYEDEYAYQMGKAMKEHATDIEAALITGTGNSGASGTPRRLKGILPFIATTVTTGTGTGNEALTQTMFNTTLQNVWTAGGRPDSAYVNATQKGVINGFTGNASEVVVQSSGERVYNNVTYYNSSFGVIRIVLHWMMPAAQVLITNDDMWKVAILRPTHRPDVAKTGSATKGIIETELTLEARHEAASGKITELS